MAGRIVGSTPRQDGYRMPGEFEPQERVYMIWPERHDNWRDHAVPAQRAYADVARAISQFEEVVMLVSPAAYEECREQLPEEIRVLEMTSNDAWVRDSGPTFVVGPEGMRAVDWTFNAWGGLVDGLYFPWDQDDLVARKICEIENVDSYRTEGFVMEGGAFHTDGDGTVLTTRMCLLSKGRNPQLRQPEIEHRLREYLGAERVIWLEEGIDPEETNGHVDDVACFARPGEVICIDTDDPTHPFYHAAKAAIETLESAVDARGRRLKVHHLCCTKAPVRIPEDYHVAAAQSARAMRPGDLCIASYANLLIVNGGVIVPQYDDENDALALEQIQAIYPDRRVVGVHTREIVYGGGNIHCITQQVPRMH